MTLEINSFIFVTIFLNFLICGSFHDIDESKLGEKISFTVPELSEEETRSNHMPNHLRCDACLAVVHQMTSALGKASTRKDNLKESEIIEILEDVCNKEFEEYGLKQIDGTNRLSGPGLETQHVMGMTQMGGRWPHRLQEMCHYYVGEMGELEIYAHFLKGHDLFRKVLCFGRGIYSHCVNLKPPQRTEL